MVALKLGVFSNSNVLKICHVVNPKFRVRLKLYFIYNILSHFENINEQIIQNLSRNSCMIGENPACHARYDVTNNADW